MWNTVGAAETVFSSRCFAVSRELSTGGGEGCSWNPMCWAKENT